MLSNTANLVYGLLISGGPRTAAQLVARTGLSQPVVSRALKEVAQETARLLTHRDGRSIIYGLARQVRALPAAIPVYQVSPAPTMGSSSLFGDLAALEGSGFLFTRRDGSTELYEGLPWFLQDLRPQGYIGRSFCQAYADRLGLSDTLKEWTEDDALYAISAFGEDSPGNLILGNSALRRYLNSAAPVAAPDSLTEYFDSMAESAIHGGIPVSSAAGENPKFLARYRCGDDGQVCNAVVKFSPVLDGSSAATRWKDLLVAEHVASETLGDYGFPVPATQILVSPRRCYLESARFDREGLKGRVPTVSFEAIDGAFVGQMRSWSQSAAALRAQGLIDAACEEQVRHIETFGRLIGNSDMHFGNLSFFWQLDGGVVKLQLAPVYDMLPMLYAPEKSEVVERHFSPPASPPKLVSDLAFMFWNALSAHPEISDEFRRIAAANARRI